jgi:hypothetical protein
LRQRPSSDARLNFLLRLLYQPVDIVIRQTGDDDPRAIRAVWGPIPVPAQS